MGKQKRSLDPPIAAGGAGWIMTFADLMSLLMAFFVMLLSMAQVDKDKFEEFGRSMKVALGSPINTPAHSSDQVKLIKDTSKTGNSQQSKEADEMQKKMQQTQEDTESLKQLLSEQIATKEVEIESKGRVIVIRMLESGVFESGKPELVEDFVPVLAKMRATLKKMDGEIVVSGHADDIPIVNDRFRSNWELSAARAYSVIEVLSSGKDLENDRFVLRGFGESRPLVPNVDAKSRAKNRRVEIMLDQRDPEKVKSDTTKDMNLTEVQPVDPAVELASQVPEGVSDVIQTSDLLPGSVQEVTSLPNEQPTIPLESFSSEQALSNAAGQGLDNFTDQVLDNTSGQLLDNTI